MPTCADCGRNRPAGQLTHDAQAMRWACPPGDPGCVSMYAARIESYSGGFPTGPPGPVAVVPPPRDPAERDREMRERRERAASRAGLDERTLAAVRAELAKAVA